MNIDKIKELTKQEPTPQTKPTSGKWNESIEGFQHYLEDHGITINSVSANMLYPNVCPLNPEHGSRTDTAFFFNDGILGFKCLHNGCQGKGWHDVRDVIDPGYRSKQLDWERTQKAVQKLRQEPDAADKSVTTLVSLNDISQDNLEWMWKNRLPVGTITLLSGKGSVGKGALMVDLVAKFTHGTALPYTGEKQRFDVIYLTGEEHLEKMLKPRMVAAGVDPNHCFIIKEDDKRNMNLRDHLEELEQHIKNVPNCRLVVIDPITSFLPERFIEGGNEVRAFLRPIEILANKLDVAIIIVKHFRKGTGKANEQISGSTEWVNAVRMVWGVATDEEEDALKHFFVIKTNCAEKPKAASYRVKSSEINPEVVAIDWGDETSYMADDFTDDKSSGTSKIDEATEAITEFLADGSHTIKDIKKEMFSLGISEITMKRASGRMVKDGVLKKEPGKFGGSWIWELVTQRECEFTETEWGEPEPELIEDTEVTTNAVVFDCDGDWLEDTELDGI